MECAEGIYQFIATKSSVITSTEQEARQGLKLNTLGGIPTKVIRSCKASPTGSSMNMSTCSSHDSSDSEEEVVAKKRCLERNITVADDAQEVPSDVVAEAEAGDIAEPEIEGAQSPPAVLPIRVIPLRPVCSVYMVTHDQNNHVEDVIAPEFPQLIVDPQAGLPINLTNIKPPPLRTIAETFDENLRRYRLRSIVMGDKYQCVWHSTPLEGHGDPNVKYTVPFTVDKSHIILCGTPDTVPLETVKRTLEYALQRAQSLFDLSHSIFANVPARRMRSSIIRRSHRNRNDQRIVSAHRHCNHNHY